MHAAGINFDFPCGGRGKCGKCRVRIVSGGDAVHEQETALLQADELAEGIRLACLVEVSGPTTVELLAEKNMQHQILLSTSGGKAQIMPQLTKRYLEVDKPGLEDHRPDLQRIKDSLAQQGISVTKTHFSVLQKLPVVLRKDKFKVTAIVHEKELLGLEPGNTGDNLLGMAFDIGTTTIVGFLIDLYTGRELAVVSALNPQTRFGGDVISRITYANQNEHGLAQLHTAVTEALNTLIGQAVEQAKIKREDIYTLTVVGNTCMHHLFLGIHPRQVALSPYVAAVSEPVEAEPAKLGLEINPAGKVFMLPNIAGFVGADTVGVLLATELDRSEKSKLVIDIGTNGELVLGNKDSLFACSTAAGPAFEGAQISCGMRGASGAIDHVTFSDDLQFSVIDNVSPLGICGSALLDTVAGLLEAGLITKRGKFVEPDKVTNPTGQKLKERLIEHDGSWAFLVAQDPDGKRIMVTQKDIRELQLAKGAMAAGIRILMNNSGIGYDEIDEVLLAGAFGNYLNPRSACIIGLIPGELEDRVTMVGNAAGAGAKLALISSEEYHRAAQLAKKVKFIELGSNPGFARIFANSMLLPGP
ncbi:ASKHA domain-containing protein [Dethiobacter alkaliphilus]|uniref:ASKHA domain-containing protein n=1 Tax=Dethiobacter alkaliphilus TaxID=427926 RepID=UPI0011805996